MDTLQVEAAVPVGQEPIAVVHDPLGDRVYAVNRGAGSVSVIGVEDRSEWGRIPVDGEPVPALVGSRLPAWDLYDARAGSRMTSEAWAGHRYILNFFASW